jgi:hypothetical protein
LTLLQENLEIVLAVLGVLMVVILIVQLKMFSAFRNVAHQTPGPSPGGDPEVEPRHTESLDTQYSGGDILNNNKPSSGKSDTHHSKEAHTSSEANQQEHAADASPQETDSTSINAPLEGSVSSGRNVEHETDSEASVRDNVLQELQADDLLAPGNQQTPDEMKYPGETGPDKGELDNPDSKPSEEVEPTGTEESESLRVESPVSEKPRDPGRIERGDELIQIQEGEDPIYDIETNPPILASNHGSDAAAVESERLQVLNDRFTRCTEALAKFEKDFREDENRFKTARERYLHWKAYLLELVTTYENDLLYEFTETLEDDRFHIKELKKMMILPLTQNETENEKQLKARAKDLSEEVDYLDIARFSEKLTGLKGVQVRRGTDGDYHLEESAFSTEMTSELRIFLKNFLDTLLMIYRQLRGKNFKEVFKLLSGSSEPDRHIQTPMQKPDSAEVMAFVFSGEPTPAWPLDPGVLENMTQANYQHAQKAVDLAESLHKKYFAYLDKNLLRSLNDLKQARANYWQIAGERFSDYESTLKSWGEIFDVLIKLLSGYLEEHLHIQVIPCKRGDEYDPDRNTPTGPVETDGQLGPNQIKSVDEDGYQYTHGDRLLVVKPARVTVTG